MSKLNTKFSHLRINTSNEDYRKTENQSKNKQKPINEINTFRIQSPKNIDIMYNKPLKISLTSPLTAKNENNNNKFFFPNMPNQESNNKAVKPSILSVFKNYSKNKNNENSNSITLSNLNHQNNGNHNSTNNLLNNNNQQNLNLNNLTNNFLKLQMNKEDSDRFSNNNANPLNKNFRKNMNNNINMIHSNRDVLMGNTTTNKLGKPLINNILISNNTERNFKSESPTVRKQNFNQRKNIENDDFQDKVLHTENVLEKNRKPQFIDIMNLINSNQVPISLSLLNKHFPNFEKSKHSSKSMKYVKGYSANTHQGTVR